VIFGGWLSGQLRSWVVPEARPFAQRWNKGIPRGEHAIGRLKIVCKLVMSRGVSLLFGCAAFDARKGRVSHATMPASELCVPPGPSAYFPSFAACCAWYSMLPIA
jgi:hypothetical protein